MYEYSGFVMNVVDGDTLDIVVDLGFGITNKIRVRLKNIDTPEMWHPKTKAEGIHGKAAKLFVEDKVLNKQITLVTYKDKTGKYGRYLAEIVYADSDGIGKFLGDELKVYGFEKRETYTDY